VACLMKATAKPNSACRHGFVSSDRSDRKQPSSDPRGSWNRAICPPQANLLRNEMAAAKASVVIDHTTCCCWWGLIISETKCCPRWWNTR
jgi:hypothetical protein